MKVTLEVTGSDGSGGGRPGGYSLRQRLEPLRPEFVAMHRRMLAGQWHPDDVDWSARPIVDDVPLFRRDLEELRAAFVADSFAAEEFSLRSAGGRMDQLEHADEKLCYAMMIVDEYRHVEVFGRYQERLAVRRPPDARLGTEFEAGEALDVEGFCLLSLVGESFLLRVLPSVWRSTRDPLLGAFLPRVCADEERHVDFCALYLESRAPRRSATRTRQLEDLLARVFAVHAEVFLHPNPALLARLSALMRWLVTHSGRVALIRSTRHLVRRLERLALTPSPQMLEQSRVDPRSLLARFPGAARLDHPWTREGGLGT